MEITIIVVLFLTFCATFVNSENSENETKSDADAEWESFVNRKLRKFDEELQQATQRVIRVETTELDPDFYHSYLPGTGYLNREELEVLAVSSIGQIKLQGDVPALDWNVIEHRGTEYMVAATGQGLTFVWRTVDGFVSSNAEVGPVLSVLHVVIPSSDGSPQLYLAALREDRAGRCLTFYVLNGEELSLTEAGNHPMTGDVNNLRSMFVPFRNYNFIIAVRDGQEGTQVYSKVYQVFERDGLVQLREFTDIPCSGRCSVRPFLVQGEALIAVANTGMSSQLLRFDHKLLDFSLIQKFVPAVDVETFRIGLHYFLAWLTPDTLAIYTYNGADFSVWQTERGRGFVSVEMLHVPTCRDEVLIAVTSENDGVTTLDLLKYFGKGNNFTLVEGKVCATWRRHTNTMVSAPFSPPLIFGTLMEAEAGCLHAGHICRGIQQQSTTSYELQTRGKKKGNPAQSQVFHEKQLSERLECLESLALDWRSMKALALVNTSVLIGYSAVTRSVHIIEATTQLQDQDNPIWQENVFLMSRVKTLEEELLHQESLIADIESTLSRTVSSHGDQTPKGRYTFMADVLVDEGVSSDVLDVLGDVEFERSGLKIEDFVFPLHQVDERIRGIEQSVEGLRGMLDDIVFVDEGAVVTGLKDFVGPVSMSNNLQAVQLDIGIILDIDVSTVLRDIVRLTGSPVTVDGTKSAPDVTILSDLVVGSTVNDVDLSDDVVTADTEQVVTGSITYLEEPTVLSDVQLTGLVDGYLDLSQDGVTLTNGGMIDGHKIYKTKVSVRRDARATTVDDVNVGTLAELVVTLSGDQTVGGHKTMGDVITAGSVAITGSVNDVNMTYVEGVAVKLDRDDVVTGEKLFVTDIFASGDLLVIETVNGVRIPEDFFSTDTEQQVTGRKIFGGPYFSVREITIEGQVDGLSLPEDIITLSTDQIADGHFLFRDGVIITGDLQSDGLIDDVDVSELSLGAVRIDGDVTASLDILLIGGATVWENLEVESTVNGEDIGAVYQDLIFTDGGDYVITGSKSVIGRLSIPHLQLHGDLRGFTMVDFVDLTSNSTIAGIKRFAEPITISHDVWVQGLIDEVNVKRLAAERVSLSRDQEINGHWSFGDEVLVERNLNPSGTVEGLNVAEDLVLKTRDQEISGKKKFETVYTDVIRAGQGVRAEGLVDGVDLSQLNAHRVKLEGRGRSVEPIEERLYLDEVDVQGPMSAERVNGLDFKEFLKRIVTTNTEQEVNGEKVLKRLKVSDARTSHGVSGVDLEDVRNWAIPLTGDGSKSVAGVLSFPDLTVDGVTVGGRVDEVDLDWLMEELVARSAPSNISGIKTFTDGFTVVGDLKTETVNGVRIQDLFTATTDQIVTGSYSFPECKIDGSVKVLGVNDADLSEFNKMVMKTNVDNVLDGSLDVRTLLDVDGDVYVGGAFNGVNMDMLTSQAVFLIGDQDVRGLKIFMDGSVVEDVAVETVNGQDLGDWEQDVVYAAREQFVVADKTLPPSSCLDVTSSCDVIVSDLVRGVNLQNLVDAAIYIVGARSVIGGNLAFSKPMAVMTDLDAETGIAINGIDISEVLTLSGDQLITGSLTFDSAITNGDVMVEEVNGRPVNELTSDTLVTSGGDVTGRKSLIGGAAFIDVTVEGLTAGVDLSEEVVPLETAQIVASKHFSSPVSVDANLDLTSLLNTVDLSELARSALYPDVPGQEVMSEYVMANDVTFVQDVVTDGLVDGVDLSELRRTKTSEPLVEYLTYFQDESKVYCERMNQLMGLLKDGFTQLHTWNNWLDLEVNTTSLGACTITDRLYVALTRECPGCARTAVYELTSDQPRLIDELESGDSQGVHFYTSHGKEYLVVAALPGGGVSGSSVWRFEPLTGSFVLHVFLHVPAVKVSSLVHRQDVYLFLAGGEDYPSVVLKEGARGFKNVAELDRGVSDMTAIVIDDVIHVATYDSVYSFMYILDQSGLTQIQNMLIIPSKYHSLTFLSIGNLTFVAMTRNNPQFTWKRFGPSVFFWMYQWNPASGRWVAYEHKSVVQGHQTTDLISFQTRSEHYLVGAATGTGIIFYRYEGLSTLVKTMSISDWEVTSTQFVEHNREYFMITTRVSAPPRVYKAVLYDSSLDLPDQDCCDYDLALDQLVALTSQLAQVTMETYGPEISPEFRLPYGPEISPEFRLPYSPDKLPQPPFIPYKSSTPSPLIKPDDRLLYTPEFEQQPLKSRPPISAAKNLNPLLLAASKRPSRTFPPTSPSTQTPRTLRPGQVQRTPPVRTRFNRTLTAVSRTRSKPDSGPAGLSIKDVVNPTSYNNLVLNVGSISDNENRRQVVKGNERKLEKPIDKLRIPARVSVIAPSGDERRRGGYRITEESESEKGSRTVHRKRPQKIVQGVNSITGVQNVAAQLRNVSGVSQHKQVVKPYRDDSNQFGNEFIYGVSKDVEGREIKARIDNAPVILGNVNVGNQNSIRIENAVLIGSGDKVKVKDVQPAETKPSSRKHETTHSNILGKSETSAPSVPERPSRNRTLARAPFRTTNKNQTLIESSSRQSASLGPRRSHSSPDVFVPPRAVDRPRRSTPSTRWTPRRPHYMNGSYNPKLGSPRYYPQA